jgi:hypothetical protein
MVVQPTGTSKLNKELYKICFNKKQQRVIGSKENLFIDINSII